MPDYKKLTSIFCALAFALGLAACGGGGGSGGPVSMTDPEVDQRQVINTAIQDARAAVEALDEEPTEATLAVAEGAVEAAKTAITDADALSMDETDGYGVAISLLEDRLAPAVMRIERARAGEAAGVLAAFDRPRIGDIGATVMHGAAPAMKGTVLGTTPPTTVTGLATAAAGSPVTVGKWTGGAWTASDEAAGIRDRVVLYTDIAAPGMRPFSGEGGKYDDTNGLDDNGQLLITSSTDATLIASLEFPTTAGIKEHPGGPEGVLFPGMFDGAEGAYACMPAGGSPCTSSIRHGGGITLAGGEDGWRFLPAAEATVPEPDAEYRYFGWWLREADGARFIGTFHAGVGTAGDKFRFLVELQGPARYRGPAAGKVVIGGDDGPARAGEFTATATLTAQFGNDFDPGTVEGTVDGFLVDGEEMSWSVALQPAAIDADGLIGDDGTYTARTVWTVDSMEGPANANPRTWQGQFHEAGADSVPTAATGTFEAAFGNAHRMIGAFGASRQP